MWWFRAAALGAALVLLAGCGFRPLYGQRSDGGSTFAELEAIAIGPIPGRVGQILRNHLLDRLTPLGQQRQARYRLEVRLSKFKEGLAIKKDEAITRANLKLTADFVLHDPRSGDPMYQGRSRSTASFNLVRSDFANLVAEQDAERRAAREISDQIMTQLAVFFSRRGG